MLRVHKDSAFNDAETTGKLSTKPKMPVRFGAAGGREMYTVGSNSPPDRRCISVAAFSNQ
jgi:hypothetical protein